MRPICSIKHVLTVLTAVLLVISAAGCSHKQDKDQEGILLGDWLEAIRNEAGLEGESPIEAAENWGILPAAADIRKNVDRETAAYVMAHLYSDTATGYADFNEKSSCEWPEEIAFVLDQGWMCTDSGAFHPYERITHQEAEELLSAVVWAMNHREFMPQTSIRWKDSVEPADLSGVSLNEESMTASVPDAGSLEEGQLVRIGDLLFRIESVNTGENTVKLRETDLMEASDSVSIQGEYDVDLSKAEIETEGEEIVPSGAGFASPRRNPYSRTFDVKGYRVKITVSAAGIRAEAGRTFPHGSRFSASLVLNGIRCAYAWKNGESEASYLRIQCNTTERAALRSGASQNLYADFARMDRTDLFGSLKKMFVQRKDVLEGSLTLCTVTLPLPEAPGVSLKTSLELHAYASGRMELTLSQKHVIGFEARGGKMRLIRDTEKHADAVIRADTSVTAGIRFALTMFRAELMDAFLEAGAEAAFAVTMHKFEADGTVSSEQTDVDPELAEEYAESDPSWQVCSDMHANWLLNIRLNSSRTAAGKMGLSRTYAVLSAANAPLFPLPQLHLEHFQPVASCTVKDAVIMKEMRDLETAETIELYEYSAEVKSGETARIKVTAMPEGYGMEDLIFHSSAPDIVRVSQSGEITGMHAGACYILVETGDKNYRVFCHVMVTDPVR